MCLKSIVTGFSVRTNAWLRVSVVTHFCWDCVLNVDSEGVFDGDKNAWFCDSVIVPFMLWSLRCLFFDCSEFFMKRCRRSFSSIYFERRMKNSSTGPVGIIVMTSCCTFLVLLSSFNLLICQREVVRTAQRHQAFIRLHFRVRTSPEFINLGSVNSSSPTSSIMDS